MRFPRFKFQFDAPHTVGWSVLVADGKWSDPEPHKVMGWGAPQSRDQKYVELPGSRIVVELELYVPPGFPEFTAALKPRVTLPDGRVFEVIGFKEEAQSPGGWNPGAVVNLKADPAHMV
ncbi:hypothetical protein HLB23_04680 [Nocardia uniformis]|uniref:Uncharacterized protein n=1 Tax=Nocardia uniformis TaxID=53432 RepID=A0A849BY22_9NOCA|nr:hypothetical protein [Nocardia uniformis]NNH69170.1 hypothetical protein [Nocardia uniformis]